MSKKSNSFQNWKKVWNSRTIELNTRSQLLDELIKANGFDTGVGDYSTEDWQIFTAFLAKKFSLNNNSKVFEIGCGSGAFLYSLKQHSGCKISGVDYSQPLIKIAQEKTDALKIRARDASSKVQGPQSFTLVKNAAKHKFEPVSFAFVACFSTDVICGNRRISNVFIS